MNSKNSQKLKSSRSSSTVKCWLTLEKCVLLLMPTLIERMRQAIQPVSRLDQHFKSTLAMFENEQSRNDELCSYWTQIGKMTTLMGTARFPNLNRLAKCILSPPVSNAETESV